MNRIAARQIVVAIGMLLITPVAGSAQTAPPTSSKLPPGLTVSAAIGRAISSGRSSDQPAIAGSVEIAMNRFMLVQGEVSTEKTTVSEALGGSFFTNANGTGYTGDRRYSGNERRTRALGNFIARLGAGRVFAMAGAGVGVSYYSREETSSIAGCVPLPPSILCSAGNYGPYRYGSAELAASLLAGLDVRVSRQLTAFVTVRKAVATSALAGVRWTVRDAPVAPRWSSAAPDAVASSLGKGVHVVAWDGSRATGTLVGMTDSKVTIQTSRGETSIPLTEVRGIRRVSHAIRDGALVGLAGGVGFGVAACVMEACEGGEGLYVSESLLVFGGMGAGVGAIAGAIVNLSRAGQRVVWVSPKESHLTVTPMLGPRTAGVAGRIAW